MRQRIRKELIFSLLLMAFGLLLVGCGTAGEVEVDGNGNGAGAQPPQNIPTYFVEEMTINLMESFPVQVSVSVHGNLADGCTSLEGITSRRDGETFELEIQTSNSGQEACAAIAPPFEENVSLDVEGLPAGTYTVKVGEKTSTFTLEMDNSAVSTTNASDVTITLERTACFGFCPIYRVAIHGDGTVEYEGIDFVEVKGKQSSNIGADAVSGLVDAFLEAGYLDWNDAYTERYVSDMPSAITSITLDGERKQIDHYEGDESAPEDLRKLEALIDSVANSAQWIGNGAPLPTEGTLAGTSWFFSSGEIDGESFSSFAGTPITLGFDAEQISGNAGCNSFFGSYAVEGESLTIGAIGATRMACEPDIMDLEMKLLTALETTQSFTHDPESLTLTLPNGTLYFTSNEVDGNDDSAQQPPTYFVEEMTINLMESFPVQVNVWVRGNLADGCTELEGITSSLDGETFELEIATSHSGQEACAAIAPPLEQTVPLDVQGLPAGTYTVKAGDKMSTFTLDMDNGDARLPTEVTLAGTSWLFSWGEIDGESFSSFAGVPITLDFDAEQISGNASCNDFFGSYTVEDDNLTLGPIGSTRRACEPDIAELEFKFLTALESVQSFTHDPDSLTLTLPNGALHFTANMIIEKTLFVGAEQVDCQGVAPRTCYLVKEEPNGEWEYFYDKIVGFEWEAGYEYELRVRVIPVENPPADASSLRYELVEVVSQNPTQ